MDDYDYSFDILLDDISNSWFEPEPYSFKDLWKDFFIGIRYRYNIPKDDLHNYRKYLQWTKKDFLS